MDDTHARNGRTLFMCRNLTRSYGRGSFTLGPLSLDIGHGVTCLVGPNGAGKSTFFRLAARVDAPSSGTITIGQNSNLGYLPQDPQLPPQATLEEFLHYVAWLQRIPRRQRRDAVETALTLVGLAERRSNRIKSLSGGMYRRLGIAHALVHDPALLLLDEPTVGLDPRQRISIRETVKKVSGHRTVIVATHLVEDVRALADRVIVLNQGSVTYDGDIGRLERQAPNDAPGESALERAIASLIEEAA